MYGRVNLHKMGGETASIASSQLDYKYTLATCTVEKHTLKDVIRRSVTRNNPQNIYKTHLFQLMFVGCGDWDARKIVT